MSTISSVGLDSQSLFLQQIQGKPRTDGSQDDGPGATSFDSKFAAAAQALGVDSSKVPDLLQQIQDAVKNAKSSAASQNGSNNTGSISSAIDNVLKANGIDPEKFKAQLQSQGGVRGRRGHHHHHSAQSTQTAQTGQSQDASSATGSLAASPLLSATTGSGSQVDTAA